MAEEFKNLAVVQSFQSSNSSSKTFNLNSQDFNPRKLQKQNNNQGGTVDKQNWVPQQQKSAKDNKQWKRKDATKDPQPLNGLQKSFSQVSYQKKEPKTQLKHSQSNSEKYDDFKSVQKQMSLQNQSANQLLGFSYNDDDYFQNPSYSNTYRGKARKRGGRNHYRPQKEFSVQSAFKFIVKRGKDYILNLYDPNENIEWKDVVQVIFNMINASDVQCPICLENLPQMIAPKITKCGHIYCWPCVLQYLAFERERNWKRCPLCNESIYKHELKNVKIVQSNYYKEGNTIKLNLMVRNKANIIVKDKNEEKLKGAALPTSKFPSIRLIEYHGCRLLVSDNDYEKSEIEKDLQILDDDVKLMQSSQEFQKIPYINEAIEHCNVQLNKFNNPSQQQEPEELVDFEEKKRVHNKKQTLKKQLESPEEIEENGNDFYYFYQSSTGENIFLHPICYKILQQQYSDYQNYPTQIEAQVLEVNHGIADQDDPEFYKHKDLNHLPDGAPYGFIEVDMSDLVSEAVYRDFEKQLSYREKQRQRKQQREETYADKVSNFHHEKFEQQKRDAIKSMSASVFLKPGVVINLENRDSIEEVNEEEIKQGEIPETNEQEVQEQTLTKDQKLWKELGNLMVMDKNKVHAIRKDTFEGAEVMRQAKKETKKMNGSDDEFECKDDGFAFASTQIVVMQGKGPKKRKRRH